MINCSKCGKEIDGNEESCPHCGNPIDPVDIYNQWSKQESTKELHRQGNEKGNNALIKKILVFLGVIIVILIIIGIVILVSKKSNHVSQDKGTAVISDDYKPYTQPKAEDKKPQEIKGPEKPKEATEPKEPQESVIIRKYKAVTDKEILQILCNADKAIKDVLDAYSSENPTTKGENDMEYIQLNDEFNTKDKVTQYLKGKITSKKIKEIMESHSFSVHEGLLYVVHGDKGLFMDLSKAKITHRNNTEAGIKVNLSGENSFGEGEVKEGNLIFENDKLVVNQWSFF